MADEHTHDELCCLAVNWLKRSGSRNGPGCQVAISEIRNGVKSGETPDALGYRAGVQNEATVLVEVKVSKSDFWADRKKAHRRDLSLGVGKYRYYMAPAGLLKPEEMPEGWGLIEVNPRGVIQPVSGHVFLRYGQNDTWAFEERNKDLEISLLARLMGRVGDADQLNRKFKELNTERDRLAQKCDRLEAVNRELGAQLAHARAT